MLATCKTSGCLHTGDLPGYNGLLKTNRTDAQRLQLKKRPLFLPFVSPAKLFS